MKKVYQAYALDMYTTNNLEEAISFSQKKLKEAPEGSLFVKRIGGVDRYYYGEASENASYLSKNESETIKAYQEKAYCKELLKTAEENLAVLKRIQKLEGKLASLDKVYFDIPENKRNLISPYVSQQSEKARKKIEAECKAWETGNVTKRGLSGNASLTTLNGEEVRSKSELIIADRLKNAGIPYFYEGRFAFVDDMHDRGFEIWFPDFQVLNVRTGDLFLWEHFGMMDNPEYCASSQIKIETYAKHGYVLGKNLIVTMESSRHPLNVAYVDRLIEEYLK